MALLLLRVNKTDKIVKYYFYFFFFTPHVDRVERDFLLAVKTFRLSFFFVLNEREPYAWCTPAFLLFFAAPRTQQVRRRCVNLRRTRGSIVFFEIPGEKSKTFLRREQILKIIGRPVPMFCAKAIGVLQLSFWSLCNSTSFFSNTL